MFNVSPPDAVRSGLDKYQADGDFVRAIINARLTYMIAGNVSLSTIARYSRLFGVAEDSPIVDAVGAANQWHGSLAINYQF